ncbi:MAG: M48 family metalloprotease [Pseudomonadota bacterium]
MNHLSAKITMMKHVLVATLFCALPPTITAQETQDPSNNLPELGDSSARFLSPAQERDIGQQFLQRLLRDRGYISDPELRAYLNDLGNEIASHTDLLGVRPEFNLIESSDLNAFAVPGGYITFHTGLVLETEDENELAAVVGHEIAHLTQRHLPRLIAKTEAAKLPTTAAVLASILVGGQAGLAGLTLANAQLISSQLAYTREFEREADALGIRYLASAGFDPSAMAGFFGKIERYSRAQNEQSREFLRTHPLSYIRIAESESRANQYPSGTPRKPSLKYAYAKAKIRALHTDRRKIGETQKFFQSAIETAESDTQKAVAFYGLALTELRARNLEAAKLNIASAAAISTDRVSVDIANASILNQSGDHQSAVTLLEALRQSYPAKTFIIPYLANSYILNGHPEKAKALVRYQLRREKDDFRLYRPLSRANVAMNRLAEAHQADAEYLAGQGAFKTAKRALELALKESEPDSYLSKSIESRLMQVSTLLSAQQKRSR